MGINITEVERQKASKALNCDRQCPLWVISGHSSQSAMHDAGEIERGIVNFGGLIVTPNSSASVHRALIIGLAARYKLPAVYPFRYMATGGGLISYGPDFVDQFRRAAGYVDRILKGEKPADLPLQQPTKYQMVINLKTAKALGLNVPNTLIGPTR